MNEKSELPQSGAHDSEHPEQRDSWSVGNDFNSPGEGGGRRGAAHRAEDLLCPGVLLTAARAWGVLACWKRRGRRDAGFTHAGQHGVPSRGTAG